MEIRQLSLGPLGTNCYIVAKKNKAVVIDPSGEPTAIIRALQELQVQPQAILLTHAHFDHIVALEELRSRFEIPVYLDKAERGWLGDPERNGSALFGMGEVAVREADHFFSEPQLSFGDIVISIRKTPGHSPGGVSFIFEEGRFVVSGDCLFAGGIGRTDLFGGDFEQLETSIKEQLYSLPDDYIVYPGHGPETTIKSEQDSNPFI
ncbi:MBL fold metallo-hydrolase [Gracilibacillus alcaliphilus]|uniref:MBL fold metallo-hydrolase n=1 Tax=Gracilibacillus alcaliphilus TaxID=1401441 RepID=UPI0019577067|nr:MBL fold metallo-hydrolase [Gracilibacillus alcaliphilus]MBM7675032.1 glyoxylase-like metal-dependent hydrolase (beta-lactamase superfamily II) [Gracilibacillus alcaliphilus]